MAYEMVMPYHLHMPSYFLETFTEYPDVNKSPKHNELSGIVKVVFMMIHHRSTQNLIMNRL